MRETISRWTAVKVWVLVLVLAMITTSADRPLVTVRTWFRPAPRHAVGNAVFYAKGVMEATAHWRKLSLDGYLDGVALISPADIGKTVWLRRPGFEWEGPYLSVDCATRGDMWPVITLKGEIVEVGYKTAQKWGMVTSLGRIRQWRVDNVEVYISTNKPPEYIRHPIDYVTWWQSGAEYATTFEFHPYFIPPHYWYWRDDGRILGPQDFPNWTNQVNWACALDVCP